MAFAGLALLFSDWFSKGKESYDVRDRQHYVCLCMMEGKKYECC